jgi:hypothetical protein
MHQIKRFFFVTYVKIYPYHSRYKSIFHSVLRYFMSHAQATINEN